jgi:hypothetical protein
MGMFDDFLYEHADPLPDGFKGRNFQTKDFECSMVTYRLSPEGRLMQPIWRSEVVPKHERPYPDAEEGTLHAICGSMRTIVDRWHDMNYHGDVNFYTSVKVGEVYEWHGYYARFTEGQLTGIRLDEDTAECSTAAKDQS